MADSEIVTFTIGGRRIPPGERVANIFSFIALMASVVASKRGGRTSQYIAECAEFMVDVVGRRLSISDPLPDDFDWRPECAYETAMAMMEYDDD